MFYLNEFFKSLGENLIRGFCFFFFSCVLAFTLTHRPWIQHMVETITPEKIVNPYIIAVLDSSLDPATLAKSLNKLPGVIDVTERSQAEGQGKIKSLLGQLGSGYSVSQDLMDFKTVRISLNPSMSRDSLDYVRDQVLKVSGKNANVTGVKYPEVTGLMKSHPFYAFLSKAGDWGFIALLALCWVITYWLTYDVFRSRSYIIEKFQRKKYVASKAMAAGLLMVVALFTGMGLLNGTLKFFDLLLLIMVFSVFWTFSMQDWRWKPTL